MFKRISFLLLLLLPLVMHGTPDVSLQVQRFKSATSSYIEVSVYIVGSTLTCKPVENYGVEYIIVVRDTNENIVAGNRYVLNNTGCPAKDLIDVKRFELEGGIYTIEVEMKDLLDPLNAITVKQQIAVEKYTPKTGLSDIQLLSTIRTEVDGTSPLHKSGLYLEPVPFRYYYPAIDFLNLYIETYHTDLLDGQPYLRYTIKSTAGDIPSPIVTYRKVKKESIAANVFQLDIKNLITGPYLLETVLFDGNKVPVASKLIDFSRYNPQGDSIYISSGGMDLESSFVTRIPEDSIDYFLRAIAPIISSAEVEIMNSILQKGSLKSKQFFLHKYWTDQGGKFAEEAFEAYMKVARVVDENYRSGFGYGFETDRGHIFLKYGKPDDTIEVEDEPSAPPYEIWFYTVFPSTHQNDVRFLFYNPSLTRNGFELLHSTAIGEIRNEKWEIELYRDATLEVHGVNETAVGDNVYRVAKQYFEY